MLTLPADKAAVVATALSCPSCASAFTSLVSKRHARVLPCGHTVCRTCAAIDNEAPNSQLNFCPVATCGASTKSIAKLDWPRNFALELVADEIMNVKQGVAAAPAPPAATAARTFASLAAAAVPAPVPAPAAAPTPAPAPAEATAYAAPALAAPSMWMAALADLSPKDAARVRAALLEAENVVRGNDAAGRATSPSELGALLGAAGLWPLDDIDFPWKKESRLRLRGLLDHFGSLVGVGFVDSSLIGRVPVGPPATVPQRSHSGGSAPAPVPAGSAGSGPVVQPTRAFYALQPSLQRKVYRVLEVLVAALASVPAPGLQLPMLGSKLCTHKVWPIAELDQRLQKLKNFAAEFLGSAVVFSRDAAPSGSGERDWIAVARGTVLAPFTPAASAPAAAASSSSSGAGGRRDSTGSQQDPQSEEAMSAVITDLGSVEYVSPVYDKGSDRSYYYIPSTELEARVAAMLRLPYPANEFEHRLLTTLIGILVMRLLHGSRSIIVSFPDVVRVLSTKGLWPPPAGERRLDGSPLPAQDSSLKLVRDYLRELGGERLDVRLLNDEQLITLSARPGVIKAMLPSLKELGSSGLRVRVVASKLSSEDTSAAPAAARGAPESAADSTEPLHRRPCKTFATSGTCAFGTNCVFRHVSNVEQRAEKTARLVARSAAVVEAISAAAEAPASAPAAAAAEPAPVQAMSPPPLVAVDGTAPKPASETVVSPPSSLAPPPLLVVESATSPPLAVPAAPAAPAAQTLLSPRSTAAPNGAPLSFSQYSHLIEQLQAQHKQLSAAVAHAQAQVNMAGPLMPEAASMMWGGMAGMPSMAAAGMMAPHMMMPLAGMVPPGMAAAAAPRAVAPGMWNGGVSGDSFLQPLASMPPGLTPPGLTPPGMTSPAVGQAAPPGLTPPAAAGLTVNTAPPPAPAAATPAEASGSEGDGSGSFNASPRFSSSLLPSFLHGDADGSP